MKPFSVRGKTEEDAISKMKEAFKERDLDWDEGAVQILTDPNIRKGHCEYPYVAICIYGAK